MASTDARPVPRKNVAYRVTFPLLDADGDLVTGAAALDSEVSIDAGAFTDCTNEATEIATSSGMYYLDLTAAEMNGDTIAIIVKTTTVGAKTTPIVLYPEEAGDYRVDVVQWLGTAAATPTVAGVPEVDVTHWLGTAAATPTTAGVPEVDVTYVAGTAQTARDLGNALPAAAPGASGGLVRVGANSAATSFTAGMTISSTTGNALSLSSSGGNGHGLAAAGNGSGDGISAIGGGTGHGMQLIGGVTSGDGLHVHGMGTGHGIFAEAHGTGAGISAAITGNITGNVSGSVGSVTGLTASDVAAIKAKTDNLPAAPAATGDVAALLTTQMAEAYAADGAAPTLAQALFAIQQFLQERAVAGTTLTVKKLDGTTSAMTFTLDDGTAPTSITRAT